MTNLIFSCLKLGLNPGYGPGWSQNLSEPAVFCCLSAHSISQSQTVEASCTLDGFWGVLFPLSLTMKHILQDLKHLFGSHFAWAVDCCLKTGSKRGGLMVGHAVEIALTPN